MKLLLNLFEKTQTQFNRVTNFNFLSLEKQFISFFRTINISKYTTFKDFLDIPFFN